MPSVDGAGMRRDASALRKVWGLWLGLPSVALTPAAQQGGMSTLAWPLRTLQAPRAFSPAVLLALVIGGIELGRGLGESGLLSSVAVSSHCHPESWDPAIHVFIHSLIYPLIHQHHLWMPGPSWMNRVNETVSSPRGPRVKCDVFSPFLPGL